MRIIDRVDPRVAGMIKAMDPSIATWLGTFATVVLVGVTGWYAYLTRSLALSAKNSADSAARAADLAAQSVAASNASIDASFELAPTWIHEYTGMQPSIGIRVIGVGATVFVHGVILHMAWAPTPVRSGGYREAPFARGPIHMAYNGDELADPTGEDALPRRLHRGEILNFITDPPQQTWDERIGVARVEVSVLYSLTPDSAPIARRVTWRGVEGKHFKDPSSAAPEAATTSQPVDDAT